jgi:spore coat polysaccharide biosynthesis protein SpsF
VKVVAIVQARMGSTRLPGKVLKEIDGETMLARVVSRLRRATLLDEIVVATTDGAADDAIVAECRRRSIAVFRGDERDVLDRYFRAAQLTKADVVVRITADCPLIDPEVVDKTIQAFLDGQPDYASNTIVRTYPRGLDTEVMSIRALERAWSLAHQPHEREHVTPYIYEHPAEFKIVPVTAEGDYSHHRWTVDTTDDLEFVRAIYHHLQSNVEFRGPDVLALLESEPELLEINRSVAQKDMREG